MHFLHSSSFTASSKRPSLFSVSCACCFHRPPLHCPAAMTVFTSFLFCIALYPFLPRCVACAVFLYHSITPFPPSSGTQFTFHCSLFPLFPSLLDTSATLCPLPPPSAILSSSMYHSALTFTIPSHRYFLHLLHTLNTFPAICTPLLNS